MSTSSTYYIPTRLIQENFVDGYSSNGILCIAIPTLFVSAMHVNLCDNVVCCNRSIWDYFFGF